MIQHEFEELLEQFSQDELNEKSTVKGQFTSYITRRMEWHAIRYAAKNAVTAELALCGCTNIQKISRRQRIYDFLIVFRLNNCDSIRLFVVTAEFRGNFVERNTNGNGDTQFTLYTRTDFLCDLDGASEQPYAAGYIQPCFVKPKGFNLICIIIKNFSHIAAVLLVFSIAGGYNN